MTKPMKRMVLICLLQPLVACTVVSPLTDEFKVLSEVPLAPAKLVAFDTSDGLELAYRAYVPKTQPKAVLVFYHGSGVHSGAGYQTMGHRLQQLGIATYMPDIRGHGHSQGDRGDTTEPERIWQDAEEFIEFAHAQHPGLALTVGGHASGAGLTLNVLDSMSKPLPVDGVVMLAPYFGYGAATENEANDMPFANPDFSKFLLNGVNDDWFEHSPAVGFNYPDIVRDQDPQLIDSMTIAMSKALTPEDPGEALAGIEVPIGIWLGEDDVEFDTAKVVQFVLDANPKAELTVVDDEGHLTVMLSSAEAIAQWVLGLGQ
ncbi:alpha/beta hydrolase [Allohahella marinimesophila]|uniref:Alpha/beta fold hydrolase n=1 Tax=Allohahella marinimesophila TaxID=1054972 RepID=A0ABP7NTV6_9GAMM